MKIIGFLLLFNLACLTGFSQSNIRLNNYWENTYYINPASIYTNYKFVVSSTIGKQWYGFPGTPKSLYFTAVSSFFSQNDNQISQLGLKVNFDEIGYTVFKNISPSYTFSFKLDKKIRMSLGLAFNIQIQAYDFSKATFATSYDPILNSDNRKSNINADFGIEIIGRSILIGASFQNLASLNKDDRIQTNTNFLYAMYRTKDINSAYLQCGLSAIKNVNLSQIEFNLSAFKTFSNHQDFYQLGLGIFYRTCYRTENEIGPMFSIDFPHSIRLTYTYVINNGSIKYNSYGTHEVSLILKLGKLPVCNSCTKYFR